MKAEGRVSAVGAPGRKYLVHALLLEVSVAIKRHEYRRHCNPLLGRGDALVVRAAYDEPAGFCHLVQLIFGLDSRLLFSPGRSHRRAKLHARSNEVKDLGDRGLHDSPEIALNRRRVKQRVVELQVVVDENLRFV